MSPHLLSPLASAQQRALSAGACYDGEEDPGSAAAQGWQQLAQAQGLDAQEAAGAETLLHMAAVFRRGSGDLEAPGSGGAAAGDSGAVAATALRRSDFITGNTPTKRSPARRPETRLSDDLSPSPFKKAHSLTGDGSSGDLLAGVTDFRRRLAAAAADADAEQQQQLEQHAASGGSSDDAGNASEPHPGVARSGGRRLTAKRSARRGAGALPFRADGAAAGGADADGDDALDDAMTEADGDHANGGIAPVVFDLGAAGSSMMAAANGMASPPAGGGSRLAHSQGLLSPPALQSQAAMNLLASPKFDQLAAGCATPINAGAHAQPSPATLALLQSPQLSAMLEPFWTPNTGLAKVRGVASCLARWRSFHRPSWFTHTHTRAHTHTHTHTHTHAHAHKHTHRPPTLIITRSCCYMAPEPTRRTPPPAASSAPPTQPSSAQQQQPQQHQQPQPPQQASSNQKMRPA